MPEISQEELDELRAAASGAPMPAPAENAAPATVTLTVAEYEALRARSVPQASGNDDAGGRVDPDVHTHVAILADGSRYEYAGAHPTHVATGTVVVPVISVHPLAA